MKLSIMMVSSVHQLPRWKYGSSGRFIYAQAEESVLGSALLSHERLPRVRGVLVVRLPAGCCSTAAERSTQVIPRQGPKSSLVMVRSRASRLL